MLGWLATTSCLSAWGAPAQTLPLDGPWRFALDRADAGVRERWFERRLSAKVHLPGSLPAQGIGDDITVNTAWTGRQPPTTLGVLCDPKHPALAQFPTDYHSNWQWWYLLTRAGAMVLDDLPSDLAPTVQVIDDWVTGRKLGLVFEARVDRGSILVCSIDLSGDLARNPVARQLLHSLLAYLDGKHFKPSTRLTAAQLGGLIRPPND
jgi:hypothetical protein